MADTIAAIATPPGEGGLHLLRVSGPEALALAARVFTPAGGARLRDVPPQHVTYGSFRHPHTGALLDRGLLTCFHAPHSYTGEDVAELSCHGGALVSERLLQAVLDAGARPAGPGEFTRRAFVNGKLDLTQAEAVADLIAAASDRAMQCALDQLQGRLSAHLNALYDRLLGVLSQLETAIDFPEEGLEFKQKQALNGEIRQVRRLAGTLVDSFRRGKIVREGLKVVLVGKPNAGKSSLLNALLQEDRAIVTPHPGTTRDVLEERVRVRDLHITLLDTAGLREHAGTIEAEGIKRTRAALARADVAVVLLDGSQALDANDRRLIEEVRGKPLLAAVNKIDLPPKLDEPAALKLLDCSTAVPLSATEGTGLEALLEALYRFAVEGSGPAEGLVLTRERHRHALAECAAALDRVSLSLDEDRSEDLVAVDLNLALDALGGVLGKNFASDLLDRIFDDFCIGK